MVGQIRGFLRILLLAPLACFVACATGEAPVSVTTSTGGGGSGGTGGSDLGPCGMDCSKVPTEPCMMSVCNTGQELGQLNTCVIVAAPNGTKCDDGKFCTIGDACESGACVGGKPNPCTNTPSPCVAIICYEDTQSCDVTPANDGAACTPTNLCQVDGVCHTGDCVGEPKDCSFSPLNECNTVSCDPATGKCTGTPNLQKDDAACVLTGDLCSVNKTCKTGQCQGGTPKDCSAHDVGCLVGQCDGTNGLCGPVPAPIGTACDEGIPECHVGACDVKGDCIPSSGPDGVACNDHNACTKADTCVAGACAGTAVTACQHYLLEGFESCSNGWTFGGDWECGAPSNVGPATAHTGNGVIGTNLDGMYSVNQSYAAAVADSPAIDLTLATNPAVSFWVWDHTEGGTFDGWNLKVSTNGGQSFTQVTSVTPGYNLTVATQPAWGGDHSLEGWQNYTADLTAFAGQPVILRFAFRSDGATVYPGVYIDDIVVGEPPQIPLYIDTASLPDVYAGMDYATQITKTGGSNAVKWSTVGTGVNAGWLTIDSASGMLKGEPKATDVGPVTVTVRVEELSLGSNFAEKTFTFNVKHDAYYTSFEGACPNGWTLTGDWQCGVPTNVGPATAYVGTQCLATQIAGNYNVSQTFAGTTATSPDIDLAGLSNPSVTFRMWLYTEGSTYDGVTLMISTDGGTTYSVLNAGVTPPYPLTIAGKPAWGGQQAALGWQLVKADLSNYAGQVIRLRFAFQSDTSTNYAGVYIDDFFVD